MADPRPVPSADEADVAQPSADVLDPARSVRVTLRGLATLVGPTSVVTSLLYYFGYTRALRQSQAMGFDISLLGYSTPEYLLQSLPSMFLPLLVGLAVSIGGLLLHAWVLRYAVGVAAEPEEQERDHRARNVCRFAAGLAGIGAVLALLGTVGATVVSPPRLVSIGYPLCFTASIVSISYAVLLTQRFGRADLNRRSMPELRRVQEGGSALVVLLLLLTLFWSVSNYAENKGIDLAIRIDRNLNVFPDATIYSAKRLYLQAPVRERPLDGENAAYRFEYTGLKLLFRAKNSYFLRPADPTPSQVNIVIADSPEIRFEFSKRRR